MTTEIGDRVAVFFGREFWAAEVTMIYPGGVRVNLIGTSFNVPVPEGWVYPEADLVALNAVDAALAAGLCAECGRREDACACKFFDAAPDSEEGGG